MGIGRLKPIHLAVQREGKGYYQSMRTDTKLYYQSALKDC